MVKLNPNSTISILSLVDDCPYLVFLVIKYAWEQYVNLRQLRRSLIRDVPPEVQNFNVSQG